MAKIQFLTILLIVTCFLGGVESVTDKELEVHGAFCAKYPLQMFLASILRLGLLHTQYNKNYLYLFNIITNPFCLIFQNSFKHIDDRLLQLTEDNKVGVRLVFFMMYFQSVIFTTFMSLLFEIIGSFQTRWWPVTDHSTAERRKRGMLFSNTYSSVEMLMPLVWDLGPGTWDLGYPPPPLLTRSDDHNNSSAWQMGGTHPITMLSCFNTSATLSLFSQ